MKCALISVAKKRAHKHCSRRFSNIILWASDFFSLGRVLSKRDSRLDFHLRKLTLGTSMGNELAVDED